MNAIEKARAYVRSHDKQNDYERLTWAMFTMPTFKAQKIHGLKRSMRKGSPLT